MTTPREIWYCSTCRIDVNDKDAHLASHFSKKEVGMKTPREIATEIMSDQPIGYIEREQIEAAIAAAIALARVEELEACARIALGWTDVSPDEDARGVAMQIAKEIRGRGDNR